MRFETVLIAIVTALCLFGGIVWLSGGAPTATPPVVVQETEESDWPKASPNPPHPNAVVDMVYFDFGVMQVGEEMSHTFVIRNEGEAPLQVKQGRTDCKCTVSELKDGEVPVGESVEVVLTWRPESADSNFEKRAIIHTNDPENMELPIGIRGRVVQYLVIEPLEGDWNLGNISETEPTESTGGVYSAVADTIEVASIETSQDYIEVETVPMTDTELAMRQASSGHKVELRVAPDMPVGGFREKVTLDVTLGDEKTKQVTFYVSGRRLGPIQVVPVGRARWYPQAQVLDMGRFPSADGHKATLNITVRGLSDGDWEFTQVETDPSFLKVSLNRDGRFTVGGIQRYELNFEVPAGSPRVARTREKPAKVKIATNHPIIQEMEFRVVFVAL